MIKRWKRFRQAFLMILALLCLTAAAHAENEVSLHDYLPYKGGKTTIAWDIKDEGKTQYLVTYKVIDNGTAEQSVLEAGKTFGNSVETPGIIPGKCYEISVKDLMGNILDQKAYRMDEAETFQDGNLKNTSIKIYIKPSRMESGKDPKQISTLKAADMEKGFSNKSVYYGLWYKMAMPQKIKARNVYVTLAFESPDGYVYVDKVTNLEVEKNKGREEFYWKIAGADFFWQMYRQNGRIPTGKYAVYLFWNGQLVNTSTFTIK